jgi:peptidoglycan LD-endopeptidase CwlK
MVLEHPRLLISAPKEWILLRNEINNLREMPTFSQASRDKLSSCSFELQLLFNYVVQFYDCTIVCGYRPKADQEKAFSDGLSKVHYPGTHSTKPSIAVDVAPYETTGIDWGKIQTAHFAGFVMGVASMLFKQGVMKHKIRSGADWNGNMDVDDTTFWDACHFELVLTDEEKTNIKYFEV